MQIGLELYRGTSINIDRVRNRDVSVKPRHSGPSMLNQTFSNHHTINNHIPCLFNNDRLECCPHSHVALDDNVAFRTSVQRNLLACITTRIAEQVTTATEFVFGDKDRGTTRITKRVQFIANLGSYLEISCGARLFIRKRNFPTTTLARAARPQLLALTVYERHTLKLDVYFALMLNRKFTGVVTRDQIQSSEPAISTTVQQIH